MKRSLAVFFVLVFSLSAVAAESPLLAPQTPAGPSASAAPRTAPAASAPSQLKKARVHVYSRVQRTSGVVAGVSRHSLVLAIGGRRLRVGLAPRTLVRTASGRREGLAALRKGERIWVKYVRDAKGRRALEIDIS